MTKSVIVSIIGKPNAGKSTLLNNLVGQKISIVTHKVQTTRSVIKGILTKDETQYIFLDTPGIFTPKKTLEKAMLRAAWSSISGTDILCVLIDIYDSQPFNDEFKKILKYISEISAPKIISLNKIDKFTDSKEIPNKSLNFDELNEFANLNLFPKNDSLREKFNLLNSHFSDSKIYLVSASENNNTDILLKGMDDLSKSSPFLYSEDEITTAPMRFLCSEITREQLFLQLSEELPYNLTVETEKWEQVSEKEVKIYQNIIVNRESHKMIILGKNGNKIKQISMKSREEITKNFDMKAHLFLFVKVREDWDTKSSYYINMGLELPNK